jgi:hypothetical protein
MACLRVLVAGLNFGDDAAAYLAGQQVGRLLRSARQDALESSKLNS